MIYEGYTLGERQGTSLDLDAPLCLVVEIQVIDKSNKIYLSVSVVYVTVQGSKI